MPDEVIKELRCRSLIFIVWLCGLPLRGLRGLFIAVFLILAAASTAIIRSLTSPDGVSDITYNNVTVTSTPTDETALLKTNLLPMSQRVHGGASIGTGSAKAVRNASTKRKRGAVHSRIHAHDRYQVYDGKRRVGADPDLNIRSTLARQHTWLN